MSRTNLAPKPEPIFTHESGPADRASLVPINQLRRSVLSCLLFEKEFYEDGQSIADRIVAAARAVPAAQVAALAREARSKHHLRHVPLLLLSVLADTGKGTSMVADAVFDVVQRADELGELLAIRCKLTGLAPKKALTHGLRKGLARAFTKFDAYQIGKYNRDSAVIKLRDALFLSHAKPRSEEQTQLFRELATKTLASPDTWEVALSAGADKYVTFTRLLMDKRLGYLALLRNLRNMVDSGVDLDLVRGAVLARRNGAELVLPMRFIAAARAAPRLEPELDLALKLSSPVPLAGETIVLVDVSGSMNERLSARSDLTRADAAAGLASIIPGRVRVFTFSNHVMEVPPRRGMAGVEAILSSQPHAGTAMGDAVNRVNAERYDRLIVLSDEQSAQAVPPPRGRAFMVNVSSTRHGVAYGAWVHIDGFSENVLTFIAEYERQSA